MRIKKVYPLLAEKALKTQRHLAYRWWTILRGSKPDGVEWFTWPEVESVFAEYGLSRTQVYRLRNDGYAEDFFCLGDRLYLRSLESVCQTLNTAPGRPVIVTYDDLHSLTRFKSFIHASRFARGGVRVSRQGISDARRISPDTQRRYEKAQGVKVEHNIIFTPHNQQSAETLPVPKDNRLGEHFDRRHVVEATVVGVPGFAWQGVNTYRFAGADKCRHGQSRKIGRKMNGDSGPSHGDGVERSRYYLRSISRSHGRTCAVPLVSGRVRGLHEGAIWWHVEGRI